tara:strand:+ start:162 stop:353 length:192 start_codon:yes stop_codon:yes gene_type:complete
MKKLLLILPFVLFTACGTSYVTNDGKRLLENSALGCVAGEVLFGECAKGAAIAGGATIITDQK